MSVYEDYLNRHFPYSDGESAYKNLDKLCENLGYGQGFMRNRALEEFFIDNPGAIDALLMWVEQQMERSWEWEDNLKKVLIDDGEYEEEEYRRDCKNGLYPDQENVAN